MEQPDCEAGLGRHRHHLTPLSALKYSFVKRSPQKSQWPSMNIWKGGGIAEGQIIAPAIGSEDSGLGDLIGMPCDQRHTIRAHTIRAQ
jgi:hypothetical protein